VKATTFAVAALLLLGLLVRLDGIGRPALDASRYQSSAVVIRQYHSAVLAREYYFRLGVRSRPPSAGRRRRSGGTSR
jgi:hypothetical protein